MKVNDAFIVDIATLLPPRYRPEYLLGHLYGQPGVASEVLTLAAKASRNTRVRALSSVLDFDAYPAKKLISDCHTPKQWCCSLLDALCTNLPIADVGFFSVSYNVSSHIDVLPNLACQVAHERKLRLRSPPQEMPYHGCASGILQLQSAVEFCRRENKAAVVIVLEQCTWGYDPICDRDDDDFRASLRTHILFGDGAAALLIVPESLMGRFPNALRVVDVDTGFRSGNAVAMRNGRFLVGEDVCKTVPRLVASECVRPLLARHHLDVCDVRDWAVHQGGMPVLMKFKDPEVLGLSAVQLADSTETFEEFGNLSSASCLFTLKRQFDRPSQEATRGMVVAFGAGYYFGSLLYEKWHDTAASFRRAA